MNNYATEARRRGRSLLVVEGDHEKNELFWLVFKCYPELHVDMENIWIYGTNIYMIQKLSKLWFQPTFPEEVLESCRIPSKNEGSER